MRIESFSDSATGKTTNSSLRVWHDIVLRKRSGSFLWCEEVYHVTILSNASVIACRRPRAGTPDIREGSLRNLGTSASRSHGGYVWSLHSNLVFRCCYLIRHSNTAIDLPLRLWSSSTLPTCETSSPRWTSSSTPRFYPYNTAMTTTGFSTTDESHRGLYGTKVAYQILNGRS